MKAFIGKYPKSSLKKQTIRVQIDDWDTWNLDNTLAHIIYPALIRYRETVRGHPAKLENMAQWHEILDKMIESFRRANDPEWDDFVFKNPDAIHYRDLIRDEEETEKRIKETQEGFDLFGQYFQSLWN